jgi:hypothetical protein
MNNLSVTIEVIFITSMLITLYFKSYFVFLIHEKRKLRWKIKVDVVIFEHESAGDEDCGVCGGGAQSND